MAGRSAASFGCRWSLFRPISEPRLPFRAKFCYGISGGASAISAANDFQDADETVLLKEVLSKIGVLSAIKCHEEKIRKAKKS